MSAGPLPFSDRTADQRGSRRRLSRYDLLLAVVPIAFILGVLLAEIGIVPIRVSLAGAAGIGALALLDALFLNPPRGRVPGEA